MANVKFVLDADEAKAVQGFLKLVDAQRKSEKQFDKTNKKIDKQNIKQKNLATSGVASVGKLAAKWVSVGTAITAATALLRKHNELNDKAVNRARTSEFSLGSLSQLAGGKKEEMARMFAAAKKTSTDAGIPLEDAGRLQFNLESFGIAKFRKMFADLVGTVDDPSALAEASVTMQTAFGKKEAGGIRAIINKGLAASSVSKTTLNQMLTSMAQAAPGLKQVGSTDEESLAALAILSKARKSSDVAATELDALSAVMMKKGLGGKGLLGGMDAIKKAIAGKSDAEALKFFGRKEGYKGYQTLMVNMPDVLAAFKTVQAGNQVGAGDQVSGAISARRSVPILREMEKTRIAEQRSAQATMDRRAVRDLGAQQVINNEVAKAEAREEGRVRVLARIMSMELAKHFGANDTTIRASGNLAAGDMGGLQESGHSTLVAVLERLANAIERGALPGAQVVGTALNRYMDKSDPNRQGE